MPLSIILIIIGIVLAILVPSLYALGIVCILVGLVLLLWPRITAARGSRI